MQILHEHFQCEQCDEIWQNGAQHFVRNHCNEMDQCIEAGTDFHDINVFHAIEEHVSNADSTTNNKRNQR